MSDINPEVLDKPPFELIFGGNVAKVLDIAFNLGDKEISEDAVMAITKLDKRELRTVLTHLLTLKLIKARITPENNFIFCFLMDEDFKKLLKVVKKMHFDFLMRISMVEDLRKRNWGLT